MALALGSHAFDTRLLMPDYRSERHPHGAVLKLSPTQPLEQACEFLSEHVREIRDLARAHMALVIEIDDQSTFSWMAAGTTDSGVFFHADGNILEAPAVVLLTPQIDHEWGQTDHRMNRAPTSIAEPRSVEIAVRETLIEKEGALRNLGEGTHYYGPAIEELYANLEKYTKLQKFDDEVQGMLIEINAGAEDLADGVWERLRNRGQVYEHDWKAQKKRTILAISNVERDSQDENQVMALHARKRESIWRGWGNVQRMQIEIGADNLPMLRRTQA